MKKIIFFLILLLPSMVFADQNLSESECSTYQNVDQRIVCYSSVAAQLDDISICGRAADNYINETLETDETMERFLPNRCIEEFSIIKKNPDLCRKTIYQDSCFISHGAVNKDISYCLYISNKQVKLNCVRVMADNYIENLSECNKLSDQELKNLCISTASESLDYKAREKANDNLFKNLNSVAEKILLPLIFVFSLIVGLIILKKFKKGYLDFKLVNYLIIASFPLLISLNFVNLLITSKVFLNSYLLLSLLVVIFNLKYSIDLWIKNDLSAKKYIVISYLSPILYCFLLSFGSSLYDESFRINFFWVDIIENMMGNLYKGSILILVFGIISIYYKKMFISEKTEKRFGYIGLDIFYIIFGMISFILSWSISHMPSF